ncbi:MAG: hypothetical protein ACFFCW_26645 [Candidatus Hodarchaeota archaeon]
MKSKVMIISPLIVIIGLISIILAHSALNSTQPLTQTTISAEPQTTTPIYITTTLPVTTQRPVKTIYITDPPRPTIPETFATEVSVFSHGIQLDVGINDTTPQVGGAVLVVIRLTNVNSSEPVYHPKLIGVDILNNERELIDGWDQIYWGFPSEIPVNHTVTILSMWRLENTVRYANVEIKPGEDYYIVVWVYGPPIEFGPIQVVAES